MTPYSKTPEETIADMGATRAMQIAKEIAKCVKENGLSQAQAEAVFEVTKDLLRMVPLGSRKATEGAFGGNDRKMQ